MSSTSFNSASTGINAPVNAEGQTSLHLAVVENNVDEIIRLLRVGAQPNVRDAQGLTPLLTAVVNRSFALLPVLLERGADPNARDEEGYGWFEYAEGQKYTAEELDAARAAGLSLDTAEKYGRRPLHNAAIDNLPEYVAYLISRGCDIEAADKEGYTALHRAAECGSLQAIEALLEAGANALALNRSLETPLHIAAGANYEGIVSLLLARQEVAESLNDLVLKNSGYTALHIAAKENHDKIAEMLLDAGAQVNGLDANGRGALALAVRGRALKTARLLVSRGAEVAKAAPATDDGSGMVHDIWFDYFEDFLELLAENGVDIDARDGDGETVLGIAARQMRPAQIRMLLDLGADVSIADNNGLRAIDRACDSNFFLPESPAAKITQMLLDAGADPNFPATGGGDFAPLHQVIRGGDVVTLKKLIEAGAEIDARAREETGCTPLMLACVAGKREMARALIEAGADFTVCDKNGSSILHYVATGGYVEILSLLLRYPGADINVLNAHGSTPLHLACLNCEEDMAAALLERGADETIATSDGFLPLHYAAMSGSHHILPVFDTMLPGAVDWDAKTAKGETPLFLAARGESQGTIERLLTLGADPLIPNAQGLLPVHAAILQDNGTHAVILLGAMKEKLAARGLSIDSIRDGKGNTLLHYAATRDRYLVAGTLIKAGADVNAANRDGDTPLHIAARRDLGETAGFLVRRGADMLKPNAARETPVMVATKRMHSGAVQSMKDVHDAQQNNSAAKPNDPAAKPPKP